MLRSPFFLMMSFLVPGFRRRAFAVVVLGRDEIRGAPLRGPPGSAGAPPFSSFCCWALSSASAILGTWVSVSFSLNCSLIFAVYTMGSLSIPQEIDPHVTKYFFICFLFIYVFYSRFIMHIYTLYIYFFNFSFKILFFSVR